MTTSEAEFARTLREQLTERTIDRLYYGIRSHPDLCAEQLWEQYYTDHRAAEAELYNLAAATSVELAPEAEHLAACRAELARQIRAGLVLTSPLPHPHANDAVFLAYLDSPESYPDLDI